MSNAQSEVQSFAKIDDKRPDNRHARRLTARRTARGKPKPDEGASEPPPKRGRGRPRGVKEKKPRQRSERLIPPADMMWLDKRHAAGHLGVSITQINKRLDEIGFVFIGDRRLVHRTRLDEWAMARTRRQRDDGERRERAAAD